ncbi:NAD-dependent epimerase/dehydratase family protein [Streptomyces sp. SID13726]|uniref:NAD-dependent epimerase/dehydratase family protein n=1 Tax=Streptomyces sp. SID13726 TaxID=2706058 RepID=UPI0013B78A46|nr:NAD-dependent epimerase/dehydratase family protein [Streptomyces sp. SID13726]NEB02421.1 NAD-dependent epimerase/dehydratase family protein [Streptomyces sp. SID13726]
MLSDTVSGRPAVLVVGGTGFIGGAVVRELLRPTATGAPAADLTVLSRRELPGWMTSAGARRIPGDLMNPESLRDCAEGADTVLHLASYVGRDPALCEAVNAEGTRALARAARGSRLLYVSTASVYGTGPHRGVPEGRLTPAPASAASASRLRAEETVRERGGIVLRPNLVYGPGDRWFVPLLLRLLRKVPVWAEGGRSRSSLVSVQELARIVGEFTRSGWTDADRGTVYHVNHPRPVTARSMSTQLCRGLGLPAPSADLPRSAHWELCSRVLPELTHHQHALLTDDHYYESGRVWERLGIEPGPGFGAGLVAGLPWYRKQLANTRVV